MVYTISMKDIKTLEIRKGVDVGFNNSNIIPINNENVTGKHGGIDKNLPLEKVKQIAQKNSANIIIKHGKGMWYIKNFEKSTIDKEIEKTQKWRKTHTCIMWIIEWE